MDFKKTGWHWISYSISFVLLILIVVKLFDYYKPFSDNVGLENSIITDSGIFVNQDDFVYGYDDATITVFMFTRLSCHFCSKFFEENFQQLTEDYIDNRKVRFVVKYVDMQKDANVLKALQVASCVYNYGDFEKYHKLLLYDYKVIYTQDFVDLVDGFVDKNINVAECIINSKFSLDANNIDYLKLKLKGTPTFIINNRIYRGYSEYSVFEKILEKELASI